MLTRKQLELLLFINERLKESGVPPSFDEMKDALDLRSKSGIHRLITALEERGFIRRLPNRARALEVIRLPEAVNPSFCGHAPARLPAERHRGAASARRRSRAARIEEAANDSGRACPSWAASPPACRSRPSRTRATPFPCRRKCSAAASISRWRCAAIR